MWTSSVLTLANTSRMQVIVCCVTMQCAVYINENNVYRAEIKMNAMPE